MEDVPTHDQLMWPTLSAIKILGGSATIGEISSKVIEILDIPESVQSIPHKDDNRSKLEYRLAWARTYLKKGAALENSSRGVWSVTEIGERLSEHDMKEIVSEVRLGRKSHSQKAGAPEGQTDLLFEENGSADSDENEDLWRQQLLDTVLDMSPEAFEGEVLNLLGIW